MCAIGMATPNTMTTPVAAAIRYQPSNCRGVDHGSDYKPLTREWVVETDEQGKRSLRMHWTVAPFSPRPRS
jgi:hypothetical protein